MARTVDSPIGLKRQIVSPGAEVQWSSPSQDGGLYWIGTTHNTLYEQHRGVLVNDGEWDSEATLLGTGSSDNARYRVRLWGSGSQTETAVVGMYAYGNGGLGAGQVDVSDGTNTASLAAPGGSAGTVVSITNTMTIIDNAEYADLTFTYASGVVGVVVGFFAYYQRAKSALAASTAQYYTGTTFCPIDTGIMQDNFPLTSALAYTMRDNIVELYQRTGQAISASWGTSPVSSETGFVVPVPENVTTLKLYLDGDYSATSGGYSVTTELATYTGSFTASRAFTSVIDVDVTGLGVVSVSASTTGNGRIYGISGYWDVRALP